MRGRNSHNVSSTVFGKFESYIFAGRGVALLTNSHYLLPILLSKHRTNNIDNMRHTQLLLLISIHHSVAEIATLSLGNIEQYSASLVRTYFP